MSFIIDTDGGNFSDDFWALSLLLCSDDVDVKLIVTSGGDTLTKTKIFAKFLTHCGRNDIPICTGVPTNEAAWLSEDEQGLLQPCEKNKENEHDTTRRYYHNPILKPWVERYDLRNYQGRLYTDMSVEPVREVLRRYDHDSHECKLTYLCLGSASNVQALSLHEDDDDDNDREDLLRRVRVVCMGGSLDADGRGEHNFRLNPVAARVMLRASDDVVVVPMEPCFRARLELSSDDNHGNDDTYAVYLAGDSRCGTAMAQLQLVLANYGSHQEVVRGTTDIMFDCVAAFVALSCGRHGDAFYDVARTELTVRDDGLLMPTTSDTNSTRNTDAVTVGVMTHWKSDEALHKFLSHVAHTIATGGVH